MDIFDLLTMIGGLSLFLFGMNITVSYTHLTLPTILLV